LRGLITDNAYQVTSEEAGIIPLDMIVGSRCLMEAQSLQPSCGGNQSYGPNKLQLDTEGVTIRDSEFNFNTGNTCSVIERSWPS
jgi:hypothetical protein